MPVHCVLPPQACFARALGLVHPNACVDPINEPRFLVADPILLAPDRNCGRCALTGLP